MVRILFLCVGNLGRSRIAEAVAKRYRNNRVEVMSAGTWLSSYISPEERKRRLMKAAEIFGVNPRGKTEKQLFNEIRGKVLRINEQVIEALREREIDILGKEPKMLESWMLEWADIIVTLAPEAAADLPRTEIRGKTVIYWDIKDPFHLPIEEVRAIRDEIEERVKNLLENLKEDRGKS